MIWETRFVCVLTLLLSSLSGCAVAQDPAEVSDNVMIQFVVTVPADTPEGEPIHLSGDHALLGNWDGKGLRLQRQDDGTYHGNLAFTRGAHVQFKATRGSWQTVEKNEIGGEIDNRYVIVDQDKQVKAVIAGWSGGRAQQLEPTLTGDIRRHNGFHSEILGNDRTLLVYLPPGYNEQADRRYPVLYMHDGQNIFDASTSFAGHEWRVDEAAERLIAHGEIEPIIIVGMYNNAERVTEYTPHPEGDKPDAYARFVVEEVKPFIDQTYRTQPGREKTGVAGSSLGGLISLYMAGAYPDVFGRCGGVSPALWWDERQLMNQWQAKDTGWMRDTRFWLDIGTAEGRAAPGEEFPSSVVYARELAELFGRAGLERGVGYEYLEVEGAKHNEQAGADRIEQALGFLYGVPK